MFTKLSPMMHTKTILQLAQERRVLRAADVRAVGCSPQLLIKLCQTGQLQRLGRGLYGLPGAEPSKHQDLLQVCARVPKAVVCLQSALRYHGIEVTAPEALFIALPSATPTPVSDNGQPLRVVRLGGAAYTEGLETVTIDGVQLRVYNLAKTVTDCFKFRNKIGPDIAVQALKQAWNAKRLDEQTLLHYASVNRVERVMQPYLDALRA